jgi:hypothetical protein
MRRRESLRGARRLVDVEPLPRVSWPRVQGSALSRTDPARVSFHVRGCPVDRPSGVARVERQRAHSRNGPLRVSFDVRSYPVNRPSVA